MNAFSDDEVRVLKRMCENGNFPVDGKMLLPLLARMEAAEHIVETHIEMSKFGGGCDFCTGEENDDNEMVHDKDCEAIEEIKVWRKACGH